MSGTRPTLPAIKILYDEQLVSRADFDQYKATAAAQTQTVAANQAAVASAQKTVEQRMAQLAEQRSKLQQTQSTAPLQVAIREADIKSQQANAEAAQAALEQSRLNLGYTRIVAPVSGVITQRSAEVGARISKGQQLFMIVQTGRSVGYRQLQRDAVGAHAARPACPHVMWTRCMTTFDGTVESMPAVTGSRTSVLPPENATGNYVKVIQRLPVRIRFNAGPEGSGQASSGHVGRTQGASGLTHGSSTRNRQPHLRRARPLINPWIIAMTVTLATFMEVLDSSIANVALPHIAGTLGASSEESTWVITSYLVSSAIVLPMSGWLSNVIGRKRFYMMCVAIFTISSFLLRSGHEPAHAYLLPHPAGRRRRRTAAQRTSDPGRHILRQATRHGLCHVWSGGRRRARNRPNARRMDYRQLQLALDIPHQRAHRHPLARAHAAYRA